MESMNRVKMAVFETKYQNQL